MSYTVLCAAVSSMYIGNDMCALLVGLFGDCWATKRALRTNSTGNAGHAPSVLLSLCRHSKDSPSFPQSLYLEEEKAPWDKECCRSLSSEETPSPTFSEMRPMSKGGGMTLLGGNISWERQQEGGHTLPQLLRVTFKECNRLTVQITILQKFMAGLLCARP